MSLADEVYKEVIKRIPTAIRKYGAEALGSAILRASRKDTTDIEKLADAVIKSLKPKTNEEKNKPTLTDDEEKQILSKLLKVFNSVSSPEQLKSAKKYHSLALKKLSAKSLDEFHRERGEVGDLALKISSVISNKEKKYTPVDEGQIYSTGGGAGQSYRKFTPKVDKTLDEDWGSSDWTAALKDFKRDLEHVKNADDIADSAYSVSTSFNEPRKYADDPWTNFTPKQLLQMALRREIVPKELISTVEGILSGKIQVRIAHELDEEVLINRLSQESSIMKGLVAERKCPKCGGPLVSEEMLHEKKDACYYKVKSRYKVWPSAYASGALVQCRKKGAKNWGKKSESISEAYDQQAADNALFTAMKELAKDIKPIIAEIVVRKAESRSWGNFAKKVNSYVDYRLYKPYLRQAFHTPDTKNELTDEKVEKLLTTKYPRGKFGSELYISNDANTGWLQFSRNDISKFKKQSKQSKKMYQTLDTSIDIDQLDKIITDLAKYLSSDESDATGFYAFKVPTDGYDKEADSLVAYFAPGYDLTSMGASVIQTIVNNAQRPKHRATYGTDAKNIKFSKHYDRLTGHESDSGMLLIKFGDYLVDKAEQLNDYFKKYDDNKMAEILVKTWKDKFEAKDWQTFGENKGLPMPGTYEQEYNMFKSKGPERIVAMTNEGDKGVAEGFPQPGESSGKAKQFNPNAKIQTKEMTLDQILSSIKGIPYVNDVVDDWDAKDYSWGVTKKVIEYAQYLQKNPQSVANLPPLVVIDGQLNDGAHRLSAINLLQKRMDPKNPLWKQVKLKVNFGTLADVASEQGVAESFDYEREPLYHATLKAFEPSIMKSGLLPGGNLRMFDWSDSKYVYLSNYPDIARDFVDPGVIEPDQAHEEQIFNLMKQGGVILKIDQNKLNRQLLSADPHFNADEDDGAETYIYSGVIPPSAIIGKQYFSINESKQGVAEGNLKEFAPYSRDDDGDSRDIDPLREKIYSLLMKKLANVKGNPQDIAMAAMEVADDIASESEFVDFTKLPKWVEMVLNKVQSMAEGEVVRFPGKSRDNSPLGTVARALGGKIDAEDSPKYEFDIEVKRIPQGWAIFRAGVKQDVYDDPDRAHEAAKEIEDVIRDEEEQLDELKCWPGYHRVKGTKAGFPGSCAKNTSEDLSEVDSIAEDLRKWFKEKWVRFGPDGKIRGDCARGSDSEGKPKCLPQKKAHALGKKGRASAAARKRRQDPNPERKGKAKNVPTKKKK